jgi:hypothetical protein
MNDMIFNSYLVGDERAEAIAEAKSELEFAEAEMMYEMVEMELQQNLREAELKVFSEGGTYGDFQYLVEEAEAEANEKKTGILKTIWNSILSILKKIGEKLASINVEPGDEHTEVDVDEEDVQENNRLVEAGKQLDEAMNESNKGNYIGAAKIIGGIAIAGAAAGAAVAGTRKFTKGKVIGFKKTLEFIRNKAQNWMDRIKGVVEAIFGKKDDNNNEDGDKKNSIHDMLSNIKTKIITPIDKLTKKLANYIKGGITKAQNAIAGKWKEVEAGTKKAIECITNDEEPKTDLDHEQMQAQELEKKGCKGAEPGKWYIKETEKNGNKRQYVKCDENDPDKIKVVADSETIEDGDTSKIHESDVKGVAKKDDWVKPNPENKPNNDSNAGATVAEGDRAYTDTNALTNGIKGARRALLITTGDGPDVKTIVDNNSTDNGGNTLLLSAVQSDAGQVYPKGLKVGDKVVAVKLRYDKPSGIGKLATPNDDKLTYKAVPDGTTGSYEVVNNDNPGAGQVSKSKLNIQDDNIKRVVLESEEVVDVVGGSFMEATNEAYDNEIKEIAAMLACL